jgi:hypothetical protein
MRQIPSRRALFLQSTQADGATFLCTTTGASQTLTISSFGVSAETTIDWGDGSSNAYTGTALRTHVYASAGAYTVTILSAANVTAFDIRDSKVTLNSADIKTMIYVETFIAQTLKAGTFNSADVADWRPATFNLYSMPSGYAGTFNSADVVDWRPTDFYLLSMPSGYAGTFDSADVADWRPATFRLYSMPSGYAGTFDSADVVDWRPTTFRLYSMPSGYAGTFDSADVVDWRPTSFYLFSMPSGYAFVIAANDFAAWTTTSDFRMRNNALTQAQVNAVLWGLYQASIVPRTATGGTIDVAGGNAAPSGTFQAPTSCPVTSSTPGKEVAHALLNDGCVVGFNTWATVTTS